jgi:hypothetical protein
MKTRLLVIVAFALLVLAGSSFAQDKSVEFAFPAIRVSQLIQIYQKDSGQKTLTISAEAQKNLGKTVSIRSGPVTKSDALKLMRKALAEQTGIILTDFDDKLSVTYNEQFATEFVFSIKKMEQRKSKR